MRIDVHKEKNETATRLLKLNEAVAGRARNLPITRRLSNITSPKLCTVVF